MREEENGHGGRPRGTPLDTLRLWELLFAGLEGYLVTFVGRQSERPDARTNELDRTQQRYWRYPNDAAKAAAYLDAKSGAGCDAYFGVHLFRKSGNRRKDNALDLAGAAWVDGDGAEVPPEWPQPNVVIGSSPGREHFYWLLSEPISSEEAAKLSKRLTYGMGGDRGKWGLGTVLRPPGAMNFKREIPTEVTGMATEARRWSRAELEEALPELPEARKTPSAKPAAVSSRGNGGAVGPPVALSGKALEIYEGRTPILGDGGVDRSATLMQIASVLFNAGLQRPALVPALEERDRTLSFEKFIQRPQEYDRIVDKLEAGGRSEGGNTPSSRPGGSRGTSSPASDSPATPTATDKQHGANTNEIADAISEDDHFAQDSGGKLYRYAGGSYRLHAERYIRRRVKEVLEAQGKAGKWTSHRASEVVEYIRADARELWAKPPTDRVNVENGILVLQSRELLPHTPEHLSPVQLPVSYDPEAECPAWERFAATSFPEDAQRLPWELAADVMTPERSTQKAILLLGEGSNGKSTFLNALGAFVGSTNVAGLSLQKMEANAFAVARLVGKLANICPDLPSAHLTETSLFKALVGGDAVHAEYKYRESFEFGPFARLIFSANAAPRAGDASYAFFRRWLVVPFDRTFEEGDEDLVSREELDARLAAPKELSGVLNRALDALPRLRESGFSESPSMKAAWEEFRQMTDPVSVWVDKHTVEGAEAYVPKDELARAYNAWCDGSGKPGMNKKAFGRALKRIRPHLTDGQRSVGGNTTWCWLGIGVRSDGPVGGGRTGDDLGSGSGPSAGGDRPTHGNHGNIRESDTPESPQINGSHGTNGNIPSCFSNREDEPGGEEEEPQVTSKESLVSSVTSVTPPEGPEWDEEWASDLIERAFRYVAERHVEGGGRVDDSAERGEMDAAMKAEDPARYRAAVRAWVVMHLREFRSRQEAAGGREDKLAKFLASPPEWWRQQAAYCLRRGSPWGHIAALARAAAEKTLGDRRRAGEVRGAVEQKLRELEAEEVNG